MSDEKNQLIGKTIKQVLLTEDRGAIKFVLADGDEVVAMCDGDCCSHTWIEDVLNLDAALGAEVVSVEDIDLPAEFQQPTKTDHYEEEMAYYGLAINTTKGRCTIAYRNSSNGYYGGNLSWPGEHYYGGVYGQNRAEEQWKDVVPE